MLKRFWKPETGIFLALWLVVMIGGQVRLFGEQGRLFRDPGTFWHTVVGRQLLTTHQLITTDTFSFTFAGQPWIPHQWLGECLMALVHDHLAGLDSLLLATATLLACLYTWAAQRLIRGGLHWSLAVGFVVLTVAASASHFHIRPHIGTLVLLGCTYVLLCDFEAGRIELARLLWLVPLFALWTNIHGGMLGGLATVALALAGWSIYRLVGLETPLVRFRQLAALTAILLACGLTAFLNPYGARLPGVWLEIMDSTILPRIIMEHAPLNPFKIDGILVLLFGLVYVVVLLGTLPRWPRVTWLLPLVWFVLACTRIRHAPLFAITAVMALADIIPHTRYAAWLAQHREDLFQFPKQAPSARWDWRPALLPALVVLLTGVLQTAGVRIPVIGQGWARLDPAYWPVEVLPALKEHERSDGTPIFNEYLDGGFLIYFTPGFRVFVDDRCELYGDRWLWEYVQAEQGHDTAGQMERWQRQYQPFDLALTRTGSAFDGYFRDHNQEWEPVAETATANLYRRKQR